MRGACEEGEFMMGAGRNVMQCSYVMCSSPPPSAIESCPEAVPCQTEAADSCGAQWNEQGYHMKGTS